MFAADGGGTKAWALTDSKLEDIWKNGNGGSKAAYRSAEVV